MKRPFLWLVLGFLASSTTSAGPVALENYSLVDVKGQQVRAEHTLVFENDRILAVGPNSAIKIPENAQRIDLAGKFVMPGLIDGHVHHATDPDGSDWEEVTLPRLRALLQGGVTAVRDMGGDARTLAGLKRSAELDVIPSPDIFYSAIIGGEAFDNDPRTVASARGRQPGHTDWMRAVDSH